VVDRKNKILSFDFLRKLFFHPNIKINKFNDCKFNHPVRLRLPPLLWRGIFFLISLPFPLKIARMQAAFLA
jgi:hypothetical protein